MNKPIVIWIVAVGVAAIAAVAILFMLSEDIMQRKNPFIRRFTPYVVEREKTIEIKFNSYYFAGQNANGVFLGNYSAPLHVLVIDSVGNKKSFTIKPEESDFRFRRLRLKILGNKFFLTDGSVLKTLYASIID